MSITGGQFEQYRRDGGVMGAVRSGTQLTPPGWWA